MPVTTQVHCLRGNEAVGWFTLTHCVQLIWGAKYVACRTWLCVHQAVCYHLHPAEAWDLATVNRLDLNVLADYCWPRFLAQADAFVAQVQGRGGRAGAGSCNAWHAVHRWPGWLVAGLRGMHICLACSCGADFGGCCGRPSVAGMLC